MVHGNLYLKFFKTPYMNHIHKNMLIKDEDGAREVICN